MDDKLKHYLDESVIARKIKLPGRVIVHRTRMSALDIRECITRESIGPIPKKEEVCELEIGGEFLAYGKIVIKNGEHFFKVKKIFDTSVKTEAAR
jgi:hypothetical protein